MPGGWTSSNRRARLPADWPAIVRRILARDEHRCRAEMSDGTRCTERANQVDHIVAGDDHSDANLQALCWWHHARKSAAEGNAARARATNHRRPERHPGLK